MQIDKNNNYSNRGNLAGDIGRNFSHLIALMELDAILDKSQDNFVTNNQKLFSNSLLLLHHKLGS